MTVRLVVCCAAVALAALVGGCKQKKPPAAPNQPAAEQPNRPPRGQPDADPDPTPVEFPEFDATREIKSGVYFKQASLLRGGVPMTVWYYQPAKAAGKLPLVLVPPAGSHLFDGMELGEGDRAEHHPYVKAGFAVVSFEIDGHLGDAKSDAAVLKAARQFKAARAGLDNAAAALDFILAKVPAVDPDRVYVAGHSSAGTLALLVAAHEPRVKACAAFAAVTDAEADLAPVVAEFGRVIPGYSDFIRFSSPKTHAARLKCPVLLFHALDDTTVRATESTAFAAQLRRTNPNVSLVTTPTGGHYDPMIREGIPKAIEFFRQPPKGKTQSDG